MEANFIMNPGYVSIDEPKEEIYQEAHLEAIKGNIKKQRTEITKVPSVEFDVPFGGSDLERAMLQNTGIAGGGISTRPVFTSEPKKESKFLKKELLILGGVLVVVIVGLIIYSKTRNND